MKLCSVFVAFLFCVTAPMAQASYYKDLSDFPKQWSGEAGDLVTRVPASLTIQKMELVKRQDQGTSEQQEYNVVGSFKFGSRNVSVSHASAISYSSFESNFDGFEINFSLEDQLTSNVFVTVVLDKQTNEYILKDLDSPPSGHRLFLKAKVK